MDQPCRQAGSGLAAVCRFLRRLEEQAFFGTVEIRYQRGGITNVFQHSTFKAHELDAQPGNPRNDCHESFCQQ